MIDTSAAGASEAEPVDSPDRALDADRPRRPCAVERPQPAGAWTGEDRFTPILAALQRTGYDGWLAMEPFDYVPDGPTCAARSIGYVAGLLEALA
jgi:sugar phosphate isomerase/epimerase